ncbi:MAG: hypothetical protein IPF93_13375 [Saprospiraceae bacterium]|nr:hypothetical protein [Saprospiraceae bacterium]MBK7373574.1 hypothetical protein [Saprospiraceae bacterium]MBL0111305.1 hypothetical protein [Saprospiraceae bacterium]
MKNNVEFSQLTTLEISEVNGGSGSFLGDLGTFAGNLVGGVIRLYGAALGSGMYAAGLNTGDPFGGSPSFGIS